MKACILIFILFYANLTHAQDNKDFGSSYNENNIFEEAKQEFKKFESKHGRFIKTPNAKVHYLTWGNQNGFPLIWSHGSFSNGYELLNIANDLVDAGYYIIAIDYYGHGQTTLPNHDVSLYHVADDIKFIMDYLNIDKAIIGGWSRGGYISTAFYDTYPESTLGLVLEDGGSVATNYGYHKLDEDSLFSIVSSFGVEAFLEADTVFNTEREAFCSIYNESAPGPQFQLMAWIQEVEQNKWAANPGLFQLFHHSKCVWIDFFRGRNTDRVKVLTVYIKNDFPIYLCPTIIQEILQGIVNDEIFLKIKKYIMAINIINDDAIQLAVSAAALYRMLRKKGITIRKSNDCLIAQYALNYSLNILHKDRDFDMIIKHK